MHSVLRTRVGEKVRLFDGNGRSGLFKVKEISKKTARLTLIESMLESRPETSVSLALAWSKSKRRKRFLEKAVELGARDIHFWMSKYGEGRLPEEPKATWKESLVQAAKQCQSSFLPSLNVIQNGVIDVLNMAAEYEHCYFAWESQSDQTLLSPDHLQSGSSLIVIGPEGGFNDDEATAFIRGGFTPVTFGSSIFRWETAAMYCLSLGWYARQADAS